MKKIIFMIITLFQATLALAVDRGGCGGHGGDGYSLEFYRIGKHLSHEFLSWRPEVFANMGVRFNPNEFQTAVERTRIVSIQDALFLEGKEVDAINYSNNSELLIKLNRVRWDSYSKNHLRKLGIVLHEYLGIVQGLYGRGEWDSYHLSTQLLSVYEERNYTSRDFIHQYKLDQIKKSFESSTNVPNIEGSLNDFSYSCVEYSAIKGNYSKFVHVDAYNFKKSRNYGNWQPHAFVARTPDAILRVWEDIDPTEKEDTPKSTIREYLRANPEGDIISEITTDYLYHNQAPSLSDPKRGLLSYLYCSKVGSHALLMTKFLYESMVPYFDIVKHPDYNLYVNQMKSLHKSQAYKKCNHSSGKTCLEVYSKFEKIKLPIESQVVSNIKRNVVSANNWTETIPTSSKNFALIPLEKLFDKYIGHQTYLNKILRINDPGPRDRNIGLDNFINGLVYRIPDNFASSQLVFRLEYLEIQRQYINDFEIK